MRIPMYQVSDPLAVASRRLDAAQPLLFYGLVHMTEDEKSRLDDLASLAILDTEPEQAFDDLVCLAAQIFGVPIALISFIDHERQWFKATVGIDLRQTDRRFSFCTHALIDIDDVFVVTDASMDERFADNALVAGEPHIRFYAGAPITTDTGWSHGAICVIDTQPRVPSQSAVEALRRLARQASTLLTLRSRSHEVHVLTRERGDLVLKAERDRHKSKELLELVLRGGDLGLWDLDPQSGSWVINAREREMLGFEPEVAAGSLDWNGLIHPDDLPRQRAAFLEHLSGRAPFAESTYRLRCRDGRWIWVLDRSVIVDRDVVGRATRVVGTHMDVSMQKVQEAEQARSKERLELAVSAAALGLWDLDVDAGRSSYSDHWWALLGYAPDEREVVDGLWASLVHLDDVTQARAGMDRLMKGVAPFYEGEVRMRHKDEKWIWIHDRANVVERHPDGSPMRVVGVSMDITARKSADALMATQRHRLQMISDNTPALITQIDRDERYTFANTHHERLLAIRPSSMIGKTMRQICGETIYEKVAPFVRRALNGEQVRFEAEGPAKMGTSYYQSNFVPDVDADGNVVGLYAIVFDISERKAAEQALVAEHRRLRGITDNVPALIAELDADWRFTFCNATYKAWLGLDQHEMLGKHLVDAVGKDLYAPRMTHLKRAYAGERVKFEQAVQLPIGERCLQTTYIPHRSIDGGVAGIYALTNDITELKDTQRQLAALAREDPLTALPNRRVFDERLQSALARISRSSEMIAVIYVDIDHFKSVNDTGGHAAGDIVLKECGARCLMCVRKTDTVARHAGDEFTVLLEGINHPQDAEAVAAKILDSMRVAIETPAAAFLVTVSIGIAVHTGAEVAVGSMLAAADSALYQSKEAGRDRFTSVRR